jgi:hypothetical protein
MSDVDRRTLFGVAGASLAVAACGESGKADGPKTLAPGPQHGDDPHLPHKGSLVFKPDYICAIYIRFDDLKKTIVRHGYYKVSDFPAGKSESDVALMLLLAAKRAKDANAWKKDTTGHTRKEFNFNGLTFGHVARLYIMVDNDNVKFDDSKASGAFANLLRFTPYRVDQKATDFSLIEADPNYSFYNAKTIALGDRQVLQVENWYLNKDGGAPSSALPCNYSMNIHLFWESTDKEGTLTRIPIVIDPDTGNMGSTP